MPWIQQIEHDESTGFLKKQYDAALKRAGRIWGIVKIMSLNARAQKASMDFYGALMHGRSPLTRPQRELIAVVVSATNHCVY
jgi:alkylhydroperoxidase family enzyme